MITRSEKEVRTEMYYSGPMSLDDRWLWTDRGACKGRTELFYHRDDESKGHRRRKEVLAKDICTSCPVIENCRRHAMNQPELYGVWGGLTENERHRLAGRHRSG